MMSPLMFLVLVMFVLSGCSHESKEVSDARELYWMAADGGFDAHIGTMNKTDVEQLRLEIQKLRFPVKEGAVKKLIPSLLKSKAVAFWDGGRVDEKGRVGGMIEDYWLNTSSVLRVATVYYSVAGVNYNCQEWVEILDPVRAYTDKVEVVRDN